MTSNPGKHPRRRSIRLKGYDYSRAGAYFVTIVTQDRACLFGDIVDGLIQMNDVGYMVETWWTEIHRKFPTVRTDEYIVMPNHIHGIIVITATPVGPVGADLCVCPYDRDRCVCPYEKDRCIRPHTNSNTDRCVVPETAQPHGTAPTDVPSPKTIYGGAHTGAPLQDTIYRGSHTGLPLQDTITPARARRGRSACLPLRDTIHQDTQVGASLPKIVQWFKTMTTNDYIRRVKNDGWPPIPGRLWQRNYYEHIVRNDKSLRQIREYIVNNPLQWALDRENPNIPQYP